MQTAAILLVLVSVTSCARARDAERTEGVVQAAVLDSLFVRDTTRQLVVGDSTVSGGNHYVDEDYASALRILGRLPDGVRADFEAKRSKSRRVDSLFAKVPMQRFTTVERERMRREGNPTLYWHAFYRRFPGSPGLVRVSRVGFSRDGASALMLVDYGCGGLCGGTVYVLLAYQSGRWRVVRTAQTRVS